MTKKHDAVLQDVLSDLEPGAGSPSQKRGADERVGRPSGRYRARANALAERLSGDAVEQTLLWVDPERCRMWERHNRRYALLNEERCADLIEGFRAQGRQEFPAIVRRIFDDPDHDFEVICGARRHWTVAWLRANNYRQFRFLVEPRELDDEEAFRLSDVENRDRQDICDYERAVDYAHALKVYYSGRQKIMAARLEVKETWLSRFLALARLPEEIVSAYADVTHLREHHARALKPLLAKDATREAVYAEAASIAEEQLERTIDGAEVLRRLKASATPKRAKRAAGEVATYADGGLTLRARRRRGGGVELDINSIDDAERALALCWRAFADLKTTA